MTAPQYPGYPGYPGQQAASAFPLAGQQKTGTSVASLVLGICAVVLPMVGIVTGIVAVFLGLDGMNNYKAGTSNSSARGMAIAGLCCGIVGAVIWLIVLMIGISGGFDTMYYYCDDYTCY